MSSRNLYPSNLIKQLRDDRAWSLRDLEQKTGWSNQTISNLELSKADLTWSKILKLAAVFGCHPLDITGPLGEQPVPQNDTERKLLVSYRSLEVAARQKVIQLVEDLNRRDGKARKDKRVQVRKKR